MMDNNQISKVLEHFNIEFENTSSFEIYGAPSRSADRAVVTDKNNEKFIIEKHHFWNMSKKVKIAENINLLYNNGFEECSPYIYSVQGPPVIEFENRCWMVQKFIDHDILQRPDYLDDGLKGTAAAETLLKMYEISSNLKMNDTIDSFSLAEHTLKTVRKIRNIHPEILSKISDVINIIEHSFMPLIEEMPLVFCHGDYHPLNILWNGNNLKKVIDWEFSGYRPMLTDIANIIGCAGFENISAFDRNFVRKFLQVIDKYHYFKRYDFNAIIIFVIGFRFSGWLNEWIKDKDGAMVQRETEYLNFLREMI